MCTAASACCVGQAQKEAEEAAAQAAATEESRQKALGMGKPTFARSLKPLTEPNDVEFHTAKRQRMQNVSTLDKVQSHAHKFASLMQTSDLTAEYRLKQSVNALVLQQA